MATTKPEVVILHQEASSIESPKWQTSGITTGSQVMSATAGLAFWPKEVSTAADQLIPRVPSFEDMEVNLTKLLLRDTGFRKSIQRGREEIRQGAAYLTHEEVFGE